MKSHSIPSLLGIAAVLVAALVVAIAFGISTDSQTAQADSHDDATLINVTNADELAAIRYDSDGDGTADNSSDDAAYEAAFGLEAGGDACATGVTCAGYELMADVDLENTDWTPISDYSATFEGNGKTISNLTINSTDAGRHGLFATITSAAEVRNLGIVGVNITVTASGAASAGGLVGANAGAVRTSYVTGLISVTSTGASAANAGGLAGTLAGTGTITASYSTADAAAASNSGDANAGGLAGTSAGTTTASYSTGAVTANSSSGTSNPGGLIGSGSGTVTASYWATDTSGVTTTGAGVPTDTVGLQTPTTTAGIFGAWNIDVDGDGNGDDPWDFGGDWQYPVLQYGALEPSDQRPQVTLMVSAESISEDGGESTVTVTLDMPSKLDTEVILKASGRVALSGLWVIDERTLKVSIAAGSTESTETVTITAVDNNNLAANADVTISGQVQSGGSGADNPVDVTIEITDDEAVDPDVVENVKVRAKANLAVVSWDALEGADGYTVQWTSRSTGGEADWSRASEQDASGTSTTVRRLSPGTDYHFRVSATNLGNSWSETVAASTDGDEDDGASPFATMTPTPTPPPAVPPATPIPPTAMVSTSAATTLMSADGRVTLEFPAGSRSDPYQVNFESETGCTYPGAKADVTFTCVMVLIFDSEDMLETGVELDTPATLTFHMTAEQVDALGGEFLLAKLAEMGGLMVLTRASADDAWTSVPATLTMDDQTGGATLTASISSFSSFTAAVVEATYDAVQDMYGHLLPRDTLTPPTGGPSLPGVALLALLLGSVALLTAGWIMTARRSGA